MKQYSPDKIKNTALIGHAGSGKTSISEAFLYAAKATTRLGKTEDGSTVSDFDPEEIKRKISIRATVLPFEYKEHKINLIDTPGYSDFIGEAVSSLWAADSAVFVACGVNGLGVGASSLWQLADRYNLPRIIVVNKLDKERSDFFRVLDTLRETFGKDVVPAQIPIGSEAGFSGVINLLTKKAYKFENGAAIETPVPDDMKDAVEKYREMLIEEVVEIDEELLQEFMDNKPISDEEIINAFQKSVDHKQVYPVLCASAAKNIGITLLLDDIIKWLPGADERQFETLTGEKVQCSPSGAFSAYVFSTVIEPHIGELSFARICTGTVAHSSSVFNSSKNTSDRVGQILSMRGKNREELPLGSAGDIVALPKMKSAATGNTLCTQAKAVVYKPALYPEPLMSISVKPKSKADQEKMGTGLNTLTHEDPTFKVSHNLETKETIISGMGDVHLEVMLEKQKRRYGIEIEAGAPRIPYRETIKGKTKAQGKYKKQSGGRGQYGDCWLEIEPLPRGSGFQFAEKIVGGAIPRNYIPAIEKGIKETMLSGVVAGYPVMDVKVTVYDGSYHEVDSSDLAFKIAGSMGFKKGFAEARPTILEPIMNIEIVVPDDCVGDIVSDVNKRRGKILGMDPGPSKHQIVKALTPFSEIAKYASDLRSITRGRGYFSSKFSHYEEVPAKTQADLISKYAALKAAGELSERS